MRVFLDASVLIWALERPESNSARLVKAALTARFEAVVDEGVLSEVSRYLRERRGRSFAWLYTQQIRRVATVVPEEDYRAALSTLRGPLKAGDRVHLAAARAANAPILAAYDSGFAPYPEYHTPRQAAKKLGLRLSDCEW